MHVPSQILNRTRTAHQSQGLDNIYSRTVRHSRMSNLTVPEPTFHLPFQTVYGGGDLPSDSHPPKSNYVTIQNFNDFEAGDPSRPFSPNFIAQLTIQAALAAELPAICAPGELVLIDWSPEEPNELFTFEDPPFSIPAAIDLRTILGPAVSRYLTGMKSAHIRFRGKSGFIINNWSY